MPAEVVEPELPPATVVYDREELTFELGVWLVGLQSFSGSHFDAFEVENADARNDLRRRFRIANAALLNISELTCRLGKTSANEQSGLPLSFADIAEIGKATRAVLMLGEALSTARELTYAEWRAWNDALSERLLSTVAARRASSYSLESGYKGIPENLWDHFTASSVKISERIDLDDLLPRLGTGLRFLEVVGRMLRDDEPLKPTLLIFSAVHEQTRKMVDHINNRLTRFPSEDAMLFNSLDSASYSASLELKKVFQQELRGIVSLLPPTSVYARIEAAYSLLLDSYEQILVDLASSIGAKVSTFDSFPRYKTKLDQSLILREHLWQILKSVRKAEETPERSNVEELKRELGDFLTITIRFLHYKDEETFERFNEEIYAAYDKKDLVPLLHRFGAYLETLFGQICMRGVLADHPFEAK